MANVYGLIFEIDDKTKSGANSINRNLNKIKSTTDKVKIALGGIGNAAGKAVGALGKTAAAATAAAGAFAFLAKRNLDALDALGKTASKLGVSTNFLSEYSLVANQAGLSTDQFQTGLQRFIRRLGQAQQGTGELVKPLEQLGINMRDSNGNFREGTDVFDEFITKLGGTTNKAQQLALAMGAFDTEGVAFVNIAAMGASEIANLRREAELAGISIDENLAKGAERANDALQLLLLRGKGFGLQFFGAMAPAIETLADDLKAAIDEAVAGSGGMEQFARGLAADFVSGTADFIDTLAMMFDGFTNSMATATNVLKQLLVSISGVIPNFDARFGTAQDVAMNKENIEASKGALAFNLRMVEETKTKIAELQAQYDALDTNLLGFKKDPEGIGERIAAAKMALGQFEAGVERTRAGIERLGNIYVFEKMATDTTIAKDAVAGTTEALRDTAETIRTAESATSELSDKTNELNTNLNNTNTATQTNMDKFLTRNQVLDLAKEKLEEVNNSLTRQQNEQRILNAAIDMATEAYQNGGVAVSYYNDQLEKLGETTNNYSDYTLDFNKRLAEGVTQDNNRIKMLAEINRRYEEGTITTQQYDIALRMLGETKTKTNRTVSDGITTFEEYSKALEKTATNTVNEEKFLRRMKTALDAAAASTKGLTQVQQEQLDMINDRLENFNDTVGTKTFDLMGTLEERMESLVGTISNSLTDVIMGTKSGFDALKDIANSVLRTIIQTLIEAQIRKAFFNTTLTGGTSSMMGGLSSMMGMGGGLGALGIGFGIGGLLGGFFADGGTVHSSQKPIVVGERGPELFLPGRAGTVVANEDLNMGSGEQMTVNFNINAIDTQTGTQFIVENEDTITGLIQRAYNRRGQTGPLG